MEALTRYDALVELMLAVGFLDGALVAAERDVVRRHLDHVVAGVAARSGAEALGLADHFDRVFARLEAELGALAAEVTAAGDDQYVASRLKVRAVAGFRALSPVDQPLALELVQAIAAADGAVAASERHIIDELLAYFHAPPPVGPAVAPPPPGELLQVAPPQRLDLAAISHPLLDALEHPYAADPAARHAQAGADYELVFAAISAWERQRARGNGRLSGVTDIAQLPLGTSVLDGHVHALRPDQTTELIVLGDLHGCYGCLKAALLQSDFLGKVQRFQAEPLVYPDVKLVLLGDYLDRGRFGFEGVLRAVLRLLVTHPSHVVVLRGNHEFLVRMDARVVSAVNPAESVPALAELVAPELIEAYRHLFEHMPTSFLFDRTLFVHGGIPRAETFAARYRDLASLDDAALRFEMMWSDPVDTDHVPAALQAESTRFSFGREQFRIVMEQLGCHALIRGHEQVDEGFRAGFGAGGRQLYTLFSAGGRENNDLPLGARYRSVTPMALTIRRDADALTAVPWAIQYEPFGHPANNGLYR